MITVKKKKYIYIAVLFNQLNLKYIFFSFLTAAIYLSLCLKF